jgi:hypothetical protein
MKLKRTVVNAEERYRPYLTTDETRYNEVLFVVDYEIVSTHIHILRNSSIVLIIFFNQVVMSWHIVAWSLH